jgi:hypothetical protein
MNDKDILSIQDDSVLFIARSLQVYYGLLEEFAKQKKVDIKKTFMYRPGKETYQTCISILDGIIAFRLGTEIDTTKRQLTCFNAVYDFDEALAKGLNGSLKNVLFPDLDLNSKVDGVLSADGQHALKSHYSNFQKPNSSTGKFHMTGMHIGCAIQRDLVVVPDELVDRKFNKEGSLCVIGDEINKALLWAVLDNIANSLEGKKD